MNKVADKRIIKSQNAIQTTFLTMLIEEGFDQITVKKITQVADISRKTFYLHYVDKYDLLDTIVNKKLEELEVICERKKEMGFIAGTVIWFKYFELHRDFFSALFKSNSTVSFRKQLLSFIIKQVNLKISEFNPEKNSEILQRFLSMAVLGIIESWLSDELKASMEQIAEEVGKLLEKNILDMPQ